MILSAALGPTKLTIRVGVSHDAARDVLGIGLVLHQTDRPGRNGPVVAEIAETHEGVRRDFERFAVLRALEVARDRGVRHVKVRADSPARRRLKKDHRAGVEADERTLHGRILLLARTFTEVKFAWQSPRKNQAAHALARKAVHQHVAPEGWARQEPEDDGSRSSEDDDDLAVSVAPTIAGEVDRYVRTGDTDPYFAAWTGSFLERAKRAHEDLRSGLVREVLRRSEGRTSSLLPTALELVPFTRRKVEPMVRGLFSRAEQSVVLGALEHSVVFLTRENIDTVLTGGSVDATAWRLANIYLGSLGCAALGEEAEGLVGLSEDRTCYVSGDYFLEEDSFADFIVHECAHVFHNCKRRTIGLPETRSREWLLEIEFRKRETFAYSCEAYSKVLERAGSARQRRDLAAEYAQVARIADDRVDAAEVASIVQEAAASRKGWKVILSRCE